MSAHADTTSYPRPSLTADVVVVAPEPGEGGRAEGLQVLLIRRGRDPYAGRWALPGGFCEPTESVEQAAARELEEETGVRGVRVAQVATFSAPGRDPRGWVVSVAHLAVVPARRLAEARAGDDAGDARWWPLRPCAPSAPSAPSAGGGFRLESGGEAAGELAFDHDQILAKALAQLARDADALLPELLGEGASEAERAQVAALIRALGGAGA